MMTKDIMKEFPKFQKEVPVLFPRSGIPDNMRDAIIYKLREKNKKTKTKCGVV